MLTSVLPYLRVWNLSSGIPRAGSWVVEGKCLVGIGGPKQCPTSDPKQHHHISGAIFGLNGKEDSNSMSI